MESSKEELADDERYEIHKSIFENDLKRLNQILKFSKDVIDRKVRGKFLGKITYLCCGPN